MKSYTFWKDGQEVRTDNLAQFCRERDLQRRHVQEVVSGSRKSYKGYSLKPTDTVQEDAGSDLGSELRQQLPSVLDSVEVMARSMIEQGNKHGHVVMGRVEAMRRGEPIKVRVSDKFLEEHPEFVGLVQK